MTKPTNTPNLFNHPSMPSHTSTPSASPSALKFTPSDLLDNVACASQCRPILEDKYVRGAILRGIVQFIHLNDMDRAELLEALKNSPEYNL